jgi:hypothetical protein
MLGQGVSVAKVRFGRLDRDEVTILSRVKAVAQSKRDRPAIEPLLPCLVPNHLPASARIRSRVAFRNPSLYAEKTESLSNSCKGFFAEHLSELRLAFSSHSSNSSGLYPYKSAYRRFFINLVINQKMPGGAERRRPG